MKKFAQTVMNSLLNDYVFTALSALVMVGILFTWLPAQADQAKLQVPAAFKDAQGLCYTNAPTQVYGLTVNQVLVVPCAAIGM